MSFSGSLARRYILTQKRHSVMIILSIIVAMTLISSILTLFYTYRSCMLSVIRSVDSWHVTIYGLTEDDAKQLGNNGNFSKYEFNNNEKITVTRAMYNKDIGNCEKITEDSIIELNPDYICGVVSSYEIKSDINAAIKTTEESYNLKLYHINYYLLEYEIIGDNAKENFAIALSLLMIFILFLIFSARLVIDTAFEISSKQREKQYGILQSVGASKKQIIKIIFGEANILSVIGIPLGLITGIVTAYIVYKLVIGSGILKAFSYEIKNIDSLVSFSVSPFYILLALVTGYIWIMLSAYGTGMRIVKMSPIEAIRSKENNIVRVKKHGISKLIFGWTGEFSAKNIRRNKKRFFITILSSTISLALFSSFGYVLKTFSEYFQGIFSTDGYDFVISSTKDRHSNLSEIQSYEHSLDESGYFKNITLNIGICGTCDMSYFHDDNKSYIKKQNTRTTYGMVEIKFFDKGKYDEYWGSDPPIDYSDLSKENGVILINSINEKENSGKKLNISNGESLDVDVVNISKENKIKDDTDKKSNQKPSDEKLSFRISAVSDKINTQPLDGYLSEDNIMLIATTDQYKDSYVNNYGYSYITACLNDNADYSSVCSFINDGKDEMWIWTDYYIERFTNIKILTAVRIFGISLIVLISLIALINVANVISTSIINRRSEFSILKSLGMTNFQFRKIIITECLQYTLVSAVSAMIILFILIVMTVLFANTVVEGCFDKAQIIELIKSYSSTLPSLSVASFVLFVFGIITSVFPMRNIEKEGISESVRDID